jgi:two-component system, NarL family, nitrate/nitrite response regulator NarL
VRKAQEWSVAITTLLVEDDDFTRVTVEAALRHEGIDVVAAVSGAEAAMDFARLNPVQAAVLDLDLGVGPTGIDVAAGLRRLNSAVGIVILTSFSDPRLLTSSVKQPPPGSTYVVKQALTDVRFLSEAVQGAVLMAGEPAVPVSNLDLTDAQVETLRLLAYGLSNSEIARVRVVTEKSVEQAIARAAKRLSVDSQGGVNQRVALAREYFRLTGATRHTHAHR